jgi:hypothetical protein
MKRSHATSAQNRPRELELDELLHPAHAFDHPRDVVSDPDLTLNEKRAILASWASDACAVEAAPALRQAPGGARIVSVDEILESLRTLDRDAQQASANVVWARRQARRDSIAAYRQRRTRGDPGSGHDLSR